MEFAIIRGVFMEDEGAEGAREEGADEGRLFDALGGANEEAEEEEDNDDCEES